MWELKERKVKDIFLRWEMLFENNFRRLITHNQSRISFLTESFQFLAYLDMLSGWEKLCSWLLCLMNETYVWELTRFVNGYAQGQFNPPFLWGSSPKFYEFFSILYLANLTNSPQYHWFFFLPIINILCPRHFGTNSLHSC